MTRRLLALALASLAGLAAVGQATPLPQVSPADAAAWEGQAVAVRGIVRGVRFGGEVARFDIVLDGHALAVRLDGPAPPEGALVLARGRLVRDLGALTLLADDARPGPALSGLPVGLPALALDPDAWADHAVEVAGTVERGRLKADGTTIALGAGDWPRDGPVHATILLSYDARCACHRLDRVTAWTP